MKKLLMLAAFAGFASQISAIDDDISAWTSAAKSILVKNPDFYCRCQNGTLEPIDSSTQCSRHTYKGKWVWTDRGIELFCGDKVSNAERASCKGRCIKSGWTNQIYSVADKDFLTRPDDWAEKARDMEIALVAAEKDKDIKKRK